MSAYISAFLKFLSTHSEIVGYAVGTLGAFNLMYQTEIKNTLRNCYNSFRNMFSTSITFNPANNYAMNYAVTQELRSNVTKPNHLVIESNPGTVVYDYPEGTYQITHNTKTIYLTKTESSIVFSSYRMSIQEIMEYVDTIYQRHNHSSVATIFFLAQGSSWSVPCHRRPRQMGRITPSMQLMMDDVDNFVQPETEQEYARRARDYKRCYLIQGSPGTGKSSMVEMIMTAHNRNGYIVNLNDHTMTDSDLVKLVCTAPPYSVIVFDEFNKQLDSINANPNVHISTAGILQALDGSIRLSHATIVVVIVSNETEIEDGLYRELTRPGRVDAIFRFTEQFACWNPTTDTPLEDGFVESLADLTVSTLDGLPGDATNNQIGSIPNTSPQIESTPTTSL